MNAPQCIPGGRGRPVKKGFDPGSSSRPRCVVAPPGATQCPQALCTSVSAKANPDIRTRSARDTPTERRPVSQPRVHLVAVLTLPLPPELLLISWKRPPPLLTQRWRVCQVERRGSRPCHARGGGGEGVPNRRRDRWAAHGPPIHSGERAWAVQHCALRRGLCRPTRGRQGCRLGREGAHRVRTLRTGAPGGSYICRRVGVLAGLCPVVLVEHRRVAVRYGPVRGACDQTRCTFLVFLVSAVRGGPARGVRSPGALRCAGARGHSDTPRLSWLPQAPNVVFLRYPTLNCPPNDRDPPGGSRCGGGGGGALRPRSPSLPSVSVRSRGGGGTAMPGMAALPCRGGGGHQTPKAVLILPRKLAPKHRLVQATPPDS